MHQQDSDQCLQGIPGGGFNQALGLALGNFFPLRFTNFYVKGRVTGTREIFVCWFTAQVALWSWLHEVEPGAQSCFRVLP